MERPFLICPNHQSFLDPFIITANYPFRIYKHIFHVGASMFFQSVVYAVGCADAQRRADRPRYRIDEGDERRRDRLKTRKVLNIYPEGERAFDGELHEFKKGAAILATELELPILPVAIDGVYKVWSRSSR